jgi:hypothetical protein
MNAAPSGIIQKPKIGKNPNTPPTINRAPNTLRAPGGKFFWPHMAPRRSVSFENALRSAAAIRRQSRFISKA